MISNSLAGNTTKEFLPLVSYTELKQRNQVVISLLIYQGLNSGEIHNLNLNQIDFDNGTIFIKASRKIAQRHIEKNSRLPKSPTI